MRYTSLLLSLVLSSVVVAKGKNGTMSEAGMCKMMRQASQLIALAANTTKLDEVTRGNTTKQEAIKAKAQVAQTRLDSMQANATLVADCQIIDAAAAEENECTKSFYLQKFITFAANESAVATLTQNNATKIANIQLKASQAAAKLSVLNANTTLQADCPAVMQKEECKFMARLEKFVAFTKNQTLLDMATKGNTTKQDALKKDAELAQTQLDAMMSNSTMTAACDALKSQAGAGAGTTQSATASGSESETNNTISSQKKSAARMEKLPSAGLAIVSTFIVVAVGLAML